KGLHGRHAELGGDNGRGRSARKVTAVMHGIRPDGIIQCRLEAVRAGYRDVGLAWLLAPTTRSGSRWLADAAREPAGRRRHGSPVVPVQQVQGAMVVAGLAHLMVLRTLAYGEPA